MKDEKELPDKELYQVNGGNVLESMSDASVVAFYNKIGVKRIEAPWFAHNTYEYNNKKYYSRSALWYDLERR